MHFVDFPGYYALPPLRVNIELQARKTKHSIAGLQLCLKRTSVEKFFYIFLLYRSFTVFYSSSHIALVFWNYIKRFSGKQYKFHSYHSSELVMKIKLFYFYKSGLKLSTHKDRIIIPTFQATWILLLSATKGLIWTECNLFSQGAYICGSISPLLFIFTVILCWWTLLKMIEAHC